MSDLPKRVVIHEQGPREGFQIEPGPISSEDKIALIDALSATGLRHIQICSFVNPRVVPSWADAETVAGGFNPHPEVEYTALWFNKSGLNRALQFKDRLTMHGSISLSASDAFSKKNLNRSQDENLRAMREQSEAHLAVGIPVTKIGVMAAFGCNYQGDVTPGEVISAIEGGLSVAGDVGADIESISLADTMGWATPARIEAAISEVRNRWPEKRIALHLHDTRGLAVANAHTALRLGVTDFDSTVGGLGGCPYAGQPKAAGNICTEELALLCEEMGIETGIDLDRLIEAGRMAESIVGHQLPGELIHAGSLDAMRRTAAA